MYSNINNLNILLVINLVIYNKCEKRENKKGNILVSRLYIIKQNKK